MLDTHTFTYTHTHLHTCTHLQTHIHTYKPYCKHIESFGELAQINTSYYCFCHVDRYESRLCLRSIKKNK